MTHLPEWTAIEQARHRAELTDALRAVETRGRYERQRRQLPQPEPVPSPAPSVGYASGATLEELLNAW